MASSDYREAKGWAKTLAPLFAKVIKQSDVPPEARREAGTFWTLIDEGYVREKHLVDLFYNTAVVDWLELDSDDEDFRRDILEEEIDKLLERMGVIGRRVKASARQAGYMDVKEAILEALGANQTGLNRKMNVFKLIDQFDADERDIIGALAVVKRVTTDNAKIVKDAEKYWRSKYASARFANDARRQAQDLIEYWQMNFPFHSVQERLGRLYRTYAARVEYDETGMEELSVSDEGLKKLRPLFSEWQRYAKDIKSDSRKERALKPAAEKANKAVKTFKNLIGTGDKGLWVSLNAQIADAHNALY